jgi:predicted RND superfamily exporter protein
VASQVGTLGILGLTGEPLTFLSLVAIPIALGVSIDTAMNLLHRARQEPHAAARVARVNAVCAGTTLAGFGGLVFSGYRGLRGLGLAALGGVALALLVTQWVLPWMLERWPLRKEGP